MTLVADNVMMAVHDGFPRGFTYMDAYWSDFKQNGVHGDQLLQIVPKRCDIRMIDIWTPGQPPRTATLRDTEFAVPVAAEKMLQSSYGSSWRTPPAVRRSNGHSNYISCAWTLLASLVEAARSYVH